MSGGSGVKFLTRVALSHRRWYGIIGTNRIIEPSQSTVITNAREESDAIEPYSRMPGPRAIPLLGNTWRFLPYIGDFNIQEVDKVSVRLHKEYGNVVKVDGLLGRPDMVFVYEATEIERIFRQEEKMPLRPSMPSLNYYKHVMRKDFFGGEKSAGVIAVHGESWYNFRSKVQQVMLQPRTASMYIGAIEEASLALVARIRKIRDASDEVPGNFLNEINKWSLESIARIALDTRLGCMDDEADIKTQRLIDAVDTFFTNVGILELKIPFWKLFPTSTWRRYVEALDTILNFTSEYTKIALTKIENRAKNEDDCRDNNNEEPSLLERVLRLDENVERGEKTATILALDLFLVGIDTTANAVASVLYQLACNPRKQAILREEIDRQLPALDMEIDRRHLDKLRYLKACVKETLRMRPVVIGNGRCTTRETSIGGFRVPKGVQVIFQHYVMSNQEKYFPRCNEFMPERWLGGETSSDRSRHAFASLPFGYGRRMCLGRRFAHLEIMIVVSKIVQSFRLEYHYEKLDYHVNPLYTPKGPLKLRFIER